MRKTFTIEELLTNTVLTSSGCMEWVKAKTKAGYAQKWDGEKVSYVHRIICELTNGSIEGMEVLHSCDNPPCINPAHLSWGTRKDNVHDMISKNRSKYKPSKGSEHGMAKLSETDVINIRNDRAAGMVLRELSEKYGTTISNIHLVTSGKHWKGL